MNITELLRPFHETGLAIGYILRDNFRDSPVRFAMVVLGSILVAVLPFATQGSIGLLVNALVGIEAGRSVEYGVILLLCLFLLFSNAISDVAQNVLAFLQSVLQNDYRVRHDTRFSEKLASLDSGTLEDPRFNNELQTLQEYGGSFVVGRFSMELISSATALFGFIAASIIVLAIDWRIFALVMVFSIPRLMAEMKYADGMWGMVNEQSPFRRKYLEYRRHAQTADMVRHLQVFNLVPHFVARQRELLEKYFEADTAQDRVKLMRHLVANAILFVAMAISLYLLVEAVISGSMQVGTFAFALSAVTSLEGSASHALFSIASQRGQARPVLSYYRILSQERQVKNPANGRVIPKGHVPRIEFRNVSFAYPGAPSKPVLRDFSLAIEPGERFSLVGHNGAGKSTFVRLLCRFYDPTDGAILVDGVDLREYDLQSWYETIGCLGQDFPIYRFTVAESIGLGDLENTSPEDIESAAQQAGAHGFISKLPNKYEQQIGVEFADGMNISGGQQQKLALARTLFRGAALTVLDEPTAHVDADAEDEIMEKLTSAFDDGRTLILISHRFSNVRASDKICVISGSQVAELGSHDELMEKGGIYADLFRKQAEGYQ